MRESARKREGERERERMRKSESSKKEEIRHHHGARTDGCWSVGWLTSTCFVIELLEEEEEEDGSGDDDDDDDDDVSNHDLTAGSFVLSRQLQ